MTISEEVSPMESFGWIFGVCIIVYVGVCFGKIAARYGKNPFLYGILSVISPINLIILGYWAFSDHERRK
jgi:hypothetical protein